MIGFEFETEMFMKGRAQLLGSTTPVIEGIVDEKKGWHVSPDMADPINPDTDERYKDLTETKNWFGKSVVPEYGGFGSMEFITQPFLENDDGLKSLRKVVTEIQNAVAKLEKQGTSINIPLDVLINKGDKNNIVWGDHARENVNKRNDIVVFIPEAALARVDDGSRDFTKKYVYASIQMTAGIKLERIPYLFYLLGKPDSEECKILLERFRTTRLGNKPDDFWPEMFAKVLRESQSAAAKTFTSASLRNDPQKYNEFIGAVSFLAHIVVTAAIAPKECDQAKYISPILSRTNLGKLAQAYDASDLKEAVIAAAHAAVTAFDNLPVKQRTPTDSLFRPDTLLCKNTQMITINDWMDALAKGNDPIRWGQVRLGTDPSRWDPQPVGDPQKTAMGHVYEFRCLFLETYVRWQNIIDRDFGIIRRLNASTAQIP